MPVHHLSSNEILSAHLSSIHTGGVDVCNDIETTQRCMSGQKSSDNDYTEVQNSEESVDEANISAAMDDSEIFEKELLRGNEKSLGQLLSDVAAD